MKTLPDDLLIFPLMHSLLEKQAPVTPISITGLFFSSDMLKTMRKDSMNFTPSQTEKRPDLFSQTYVPKTMPSIFGSRDMTCTFILILFFLTNTPNAVAGGAAGLTFWIVGALTFLVPCVIATAQLGTMFPYEGSLYHWTYRAFGPFFSFFVTFIFWVPSPVLILATSDLIISYVQGINSAWLVDTWQQGLALIIVIALSGVLACQRSRIVHNLVNLAVLFFVLIIVLLMGTAAVLWLLRGHTSATSFARPSDWLITWNPWWNPFSGNGNFSLFGLITLGYLGVNIPLNMAGEIKEKAAITRPLRWGVPLVLVAYLIVTASLLIVQGQNAAYALFAPVSTVDLALGKLPGNLVAILTMGTLFIATTTYNTSYARFLMVAAMDQRLPISLARYNKNRVPSRAIWTQTILSIFFAVLFFLLFPLVPSGAKASDLVNQVYFVGVGSATVLWALATIFLFVNLLHFLRQAPQQVKQAQLSRFLSLPVLWIISLIGIVSGLVATVDTIANSWTPLIDNSRWWYLVAGLTVTILVVGAIVSFLATGEAGWQRLQLVQATTKETDLNDEQSSLTI